MADKHPIVPSVASFAGATRTGERALAAESQPFPLKRHFFVYGGLLALVFYALLLYFTSELIRKSLWKQHIQIAQQKAAYIYNDVDADFLQSRQLTLATIPVEDKKLRMELREKITELMQGMPTLAKLKLFSRDSQVLYDHLNPELEGKVYSDRADESFQDAIHGRIGFEVTAAADGERLMEIYVPIVSSRTQALEGIIEIYEKTSGFEAFLKQSLVKVLGFPTGVFACFVIVLFILVSKADGLIVNQTALLHRIQQTMSKYLPDAAVHAISRAGGRDEALAHGKRLSMTVLFTDIRGFTAFSERSEPEVIVSKLNQLFDLQAEVIYRHGGSIDKFIGDEILALFDAPEAAVAAAIEIMSKMKLNAEGRLMIGAGIHCGDLVLGTLGTQDRRDYSVIGDTVNTGARLCAQAEPGEILVTPAAHERLAADTRARFSATRPLQLKGKSELVRARSLTA